MTRKIDISRQMLEKFYLQDNLSTYKIAKRFNCDPSVIQKRLKEYNIDLRKPKEKINIPKKSLHDLYIAKRYSTQTISKMLGISSCSVYYKLKDAGIMVRPKKTVKIFREKLKKLYLNKNLSCSEIAKIFSCDSVTIFQKLKKYGIKTRNASLANTIYAKKKFDGNDILKSYMIGFRLGDLNVSAIDKNSTIMVKSNTTKKEQFDLIKKVYGKYGHFRFSKRKEEYCIWCNLDNSFAFLLPKEDKIEEWILNNDSYFFSFLAGYIDAEGNIGVSNGRARIRIRSYDKNILTQAFEKLNSLNINTKLNLVIKAGVHYGMLHNKDCWGIFVNNKNDLFNLLKLIKPFMKHKKRIRDLILAEKNVLERNKKYRNKDNLMKPKKTFYITTPIYYTNAAPTVGSAYTTIAADVLVRWNKLKGKKVFFLTGTDEHGQKIQETAEKHGKSPKEFVDEIAEQFKQAFKMLNISNDYFIRTTNKEHEEEVKKILLELYEKGFIYKGYYESYYCVGCEQYLSESDLVDGCCLIHKTKAELKKEEAYLFKLSKYEAQLLQLIKSGEFNIQPEKVRKEVIEFIKSGLKDISISRLKKKVPWGIELPFDKNHTCFVWVDAFWNYLTGLIINKKFDDFWPPDVQLMARDILRVHATIWPALLIATKNKLPKNLFIHGYFTVNGEKMSKSLGNAINPISLVNKYKADSVRYFLMRNIPFGEDGDFSEEKLIERHNTELANKLGNLVSRVSALAEKYGLEKCENELIKQLKIKEIEEKFENYELDKALSLIFEFIDKCNLYVQENKIWETKDSKKLYGLADSIKAIAILLSPFLPETAEKIASVFNFKISWENISKQLKISAVKKAEILFEKI